MPKLTQKMPKLCRDRSQAYVRIDGQRIQLGKWGTPEAREAYDRLVAEWLHNGRKLLAPPGPAEVSMTVTGLIVEFMRAVERRHHPNEQSNYRSCLALLRGRSRCWRCWTSRTNWN